MFQRIPEEKRRQNRIPSAQQSLSYADAGVDIEQAEACVDCIKPYAHQTRRMGVVGDLGGFGGLFDLKKCGYKDPILVSGADGVGTKLRIAIDSGNFSTIGIDLVAMCANDVLAQGAEPLFFLDYYAAGKLHLAAVEAVVSGIAQGCIQAGAALIGGETAEMPGLYTGADCDLAGFIVGAVERECVLPQMSRMKTGDVLIGLCSGGAHANGYSLIRKIVENSDLNWTDPAPFEPQKSLAQAFLAPTRIYVKTILPLLASGQVKGLAHITGGG